MARRNSFMSWIMVLFLLGFLLLIFFNFYLRQERSKPKMMVSRIAKRLLNLQDRSPDKKVTKLDENATMVHSEEELLIYEEGFKRYAFNQLASDRIGFNARILPDTRPVGCDELRYTSQLPVSVVICYYNEALSTLLRTVSTVFRRTPPELLKQIIVVDDGSDIDLASEIEKFATEMFIAGKLNFLRTEKQVGLIKARMFGARHSTGEILVFLDSHCEANEGWLQPLLHEIEKNRKAVVSPVVDSINSDTFEYTGANLMRGGFNWGLHFTWEQVPLLSKNLTTAYMTPTISGGLFAVNRDQFFKLGGYDEGMEEWGGENLEISFRTWMCGGELKIAPCSRVGHVFRRRRPYGFGSGAALHNSVRLANVWLDSYKSHFVKVRTGAEEIDGGDIAERVQLRKSLSCKSFTWYLKEIYPELEIPGIRKSSIKFVKHQPEVKTLARGQIKIRGLPICLKKGLKGQLLAGPCDETDKEQRWIFNSDGEIRIGERLCLDGSGSIRLVKCDGGQGLQKWTFFPQNQPTKNFFSGKLFNIASGLCVSVNQIEDNYDVLMRICSKPSVQKFAIPLLT